MIGQITGEFCLMLCATTFIVFFIGTCWSFISFLDDIAIEMSGMMVVETSDTRQQETRRKFCNVVQLFSDVKQLSSEYLEKKLYLLFIFVIQIRQQIQYMLRVYSFWSYYVGTAINIKCSLSV